MSIEAAERWFIHRGLPHFIEDYSATRDVFTRAAPLLSVVFLAEISLAMNADWSWWANTLAVVAGSGILLGAWAVANRVRHRPLLARPATVGAVDLSVFVLAPALLPVLFGGQALDAVATVVFNLILLGLVYLTTNYALVPMVRWASIHTARRVGTVVGLLARALPLFLLFSAFLFINAEMWQIGSEFTAATFAFTVGALFVIGVGFLAFRLPTEIDRLAHFESINEVVKACAGTPMEGASIDEAELRPSRLSPRIRGNVATVIVVSQGVQVILVSAAIGAFFIGFGMAAVSPSVIESWTGSPVADPIATTEILGRTAVLTDTLLYVAGFLASFAAMYFTVQAATDDTYREEFFASIATEVRQAFAVRAAYRAALRNPGRVPQAGPPRSGSPRSRP